MNTIFCCGKHGCNVIEVDEDARVYAWEKLQNWAHEQKNLTGHYPPEKQRIEIFAQHYERHKNIRTHRA